MAMSARDVPLLSIAVPIGSGAAAGPSTATTTDVDVAASSLPLAHVRSDAVLVTDAPPATPRQQQHPGDRDADATPAATAPVVALALMPGQLSTRSLSAAHAHAHAAAVQRVATLRSAGVVMRASASHADAPLPTATSTHARTLLMTDSDVLGVMLAQLDLDDLLPLCGVCKAWNRRIGSSPVWRRVLNGDGSLPFRVHLSAAVNAFRALEPRACVRAEFAWTHDAADAYADLPEPLRAQYIAAARADALAAGRALSPVTASANANGNTHDSNARGPKPAPASAVRGSGDGDGDAVSRVDIKVAPPSPAAGPAGATATSAGSGSGGRAASSTLPEVPVLPPVGVRIYAYDHWHLTVREWLAERHLPMPVDWQPLDDGQWLTAAVHRVSSSGSAHDTRLEGYGFRAALHQAGPLGTDRDVRAARRVALDPRTLWPPPRVSASTLMPARVRDDAAAPAAAPGAMPLVTFANAEHARRFGRAAVPNNPPSADGKHAGGGGGQRLAAPAADAFRYDAYAPRFQDLWDAGPDATAQWTAVPLCIRRQELSVMISDPSYGRPGGSHALGGGLAAVDTFARHGALARDTADARDADRLLRADRQAYALALADWVAAHPATCARVAVNGVSVVAQAQAQTQAGDEKQESNAAPPSAAVGAVAAAAAAAAAAANEADEKRPCSRPSDAELARTPFLVPADTSGRTAPPVRFGVRRVAPVVVVPADAPQPGQHLLARPRLPFCYDLLVGVDTTGAGAAGAAGSADAATTTTTADADVRAAVARAYAHAEPAACKSLFVSLRAQLYGIVSAHYRWRLHTAAMHRLRRTRKDLAAAESDWLTRVLVTVGWISVAWLVLAAWRLDSPDRFGIDTTRDPDGQGGGGGGGAARRFVSWLPCAVLGWVGCALYVRYGRWYRRRWRRAELILDRELFAPAHPLPTQSGLAHVQRLRAFADHVGVQCWNLFFASVVLCVALMPLALADIAPGHKPWLRLMLWPLNIGLCGFVGVLIAVACFGQWSAHHGYRTDWTGAIMDMDDAGSILSFVLPVAWPLQAQLLLVTLKLTADRTASGQSGLIGDASWLQVLIPLWIVLGLGSVAAVFAVLIGPAVQCLLQCCTDGACEPPSYGEWLWRVVFGLWTCALAVCGVFLARAADGHAPDASYVALLCPLWLPLGLVGSYYVLITNELWCRCGADSDFRNRFRKPPPVGEDVDCCCVCFNAPADCTSCDPPIIN